MLSTVLSNLVPDSPGEDAPDALETWIDRYLLACGVVDEFRRLGLRRRAISALAGTGGLPTAPDVDRIAAVQREIDRLFLSEFGSAEPPSKENSGLGRFLADGRDCRPALTFPADYSPVPPAMPGEMPAQRIDGDPSPPLSIPPWRFGRPRRASFGWSGALGAIFGER